MTKKNNTPRPYESRCKSDSRGQEHWQVFVPSKRGYAWLELRDLPDDEEVRAQILDPDFLPEWKVAWLAAEYEQFREQENARKRKDASYSDWPMEPWDNAEVEAHGTSLPEVYALKQAEQAEAEKVLAQIFLPLTDQQKKYLTLSLGDGLSYADIARQDNPDASQSEINKLADGVRQCVNRAKKAIHKKHGDTRPDSASFEDV